MAASWYDDSPVPVRDDLRAAHAAAWVRIASPGTWLTGAERVAVAAEARHARTHCELCRARKAALSPAAVDGAHDTVSGLPAGLVEAVHRIATDPGRLTQAWQQSLGLDETVYVEAVGVVAHLTAVDTFASGLGLPWRDLPAPQPGEPSRRVTPGAKHGLAWVATLDPADAEREDRTLYPNRKPANIRRAMSLVPAEVRGFFDLVAVQYLPGPAMLDFDNEYRAINHAQIELLAARVSALNQCAY
jgi:hypothetical protein